MRGANTESISSLYATCLRCGASLASIIDGLCYECRQRSFYHTRRRLQDGDIQGSRGRSSINTSAHDVGMDAILHRIVAAALETHTRAALESRIQTGLLTRFVQESM